jgi:predicted nuclease of predicted toxin-antitoxin system
VSGDPKREIWLDAQLPPALAPWLQQNFGVTAFPLRDLGLRDAGDVDIFNDAKKCGCVLVSKDSDFIGLVQRFGPPPQLIWVTCGNVTNSNLKAIFSAAFNDALDLLASGEAIVEIGSLSKDQNPAFEEARRR